MGQFFVFNKRTADLVQAALHVQVEDECEGVLDRVLSSAAQEEIGIPLILFRIDRLGRILQENQFRQAQKIVTHLVHLLLKRTSETAYIDCSQYNEFLMVLPKVPPEAAVRAGEEVCKRFTAGGEDFLTFQGTDVTVSGGLAAFPEHGSDRPELLRAARDAMFQARVAGGNRIAIAQSPAYHSLDTEISEVQWEQLLRIARHEGLDRNMLVREALDAWLRRYEFL